MAAVARHAPSAPSPLDTASRIGIAVSGGGDSLALLLLAHACIPSRIEAATFDHGFRPESAGEARFVADLCATLGVRHAALAPDEAAIDEGRRAPGGVQALARAWRYRALAAWCAARGLCWLLTAHHADDQAETVLMRLARGAGPRGLSGIRPARRLRPAGGEALAPRDSASGHWLGRPLLGFEARELAAIVAAAGIVPVADPSNADPRFDRTHARRLLAQTAWLPPRRLAAVADIMRDTDEALAWAMREARKDHVRRDGERGYLVDPAGLPPAILRALCEDVILSVEDPATGAGDASPRGEDITRLVARLHRGEAATIGRVMASPGERWRFRPAPPRRATSNGRRDGDD